jgi:hypothetical protein
MSLHPMHEHAKLLLIDVEIMLCKDIFAKTLLLDSVKRHTIRWWKFLRMGISELLRPVTAWAFSSLFMIILISWIFPVSEAKDPNIIKNLFLVAQILPIFVIAFGLPSTYSHAGVATETPGILSRQIHTIHKLCSIKEIETLRKIIKLYEDRVRARITVMKWLVGLLWAGATYFSSKTIDIIFSKALQPSIAIQVFELLMTISFMFAGVFIAFITVWGYGAAVDRLFLNIELGVSQAILDCEPKPDNSPTP